MERRWRQIEGNVDRFISEEKTLDKQTVITPAGEEIHFEVEEFRKHCLLNGLDDIALTLKSADAIHTFEKSWRQKSPWLFDVIS